MLEPKPGWYQKWNWCKNFNGLMNDTCRAGVDYHTLPREETKSSIDTYPCFQKNGIGHICQFSNYRTEDEAKAEQAQAYEHLKQMFQKIEDGICPECNREYTPKQVGRCVYASPCGHMLYQGKIKTKK